MEGHPVERQGGLFCVFLGGADVPFSAISGCDCTWRGVFLAFRYNRGCILVIFCRFLVRLYLRKLVGWLRYNFVVVSVSRSARELGPGTIKIESRVFLSFLRLHSSADAFWSHKS